jgi:FkbM family methyltransferase
VGRQCSGTASVATMVANPRRFNSPRYGHQATERLLELVPYFEKEMLALGTLVPPGGVCLDIGAAGGTYTYLLSQLVGEEGHVHAFEPRPRSYRFLERSRRLLGLANVSLHQLALAESAGVEVMLVPRRWGLRFSTRSFLQRGLDAKTGDFYPEFTSASGIAVECTTLDLFAERQRLPRVDFIKIDVEGAELWTLHGGSRTITAHRPVILCEIEHRHLAKYGVSPDRVLDWLIERGYRSYAFGEGCFWEVNRVISAENNYLFIPG